MRRSLQAHEKVGDTKGQPSENAALSKVMRNVDTLTPEERWNDQWAQKKKEPHSQSPP